MRSEYSRSVRHVQQRTGRDGSSQIVFEGGVGEQRTRHSCHVPLPRPRARSEDLQALGASAFNTASASSRGGRRLVDDEWQEDDGGYPEYAETNRWGVRVNREARSDWEQGEAIARRPDYFGVGSPLRRSESVPCRRDAAERVEYPVEFDERNAVVSGQGNGVELCPDSARPRRMENAVVFGGGEKQRGAVLGSCPEEMEFDDEEAVSNRTALSRDGEGGYEGRFGFGECDLPACPEEVHRVDVRDAGTSGVIDGDSGDAEAAPVRHPVFANAGKWGGRGPMARREVFRLSGSWSQRLDAGFEESMDMGDAVDGRGSLVTSQRWGIEGGYQDSPQVSRQRQCVYFIFYLMLLLFYLFYSILFYSIFLRACNRFSDRTVATCAPRSGFSSQSSQPASGMDTERGLVQRGESNGGEKWPFDLFT